MSEVVHLPDLRAHGVAGAPLPQPERAVAGWFALSADGVAVPSLFDAQRCARDALASAAGAVVDPCLGRVVSMDPPNRTVIIELPANGHLVITATVRPAFPADEEVDSDCTPEGGGTLLKEAVPILVVQAAREGGTFREEVPGVVTDPRCRQQLRFDWEVPAPIAAGLADGFYRLAVQGFEDDAVVIDISLAEDVPPEQTFSADPCALTLVPEASAAGTALVGPPDEPPRPPLLAVDRSGCIVAAWSIDAAGRVLVPSGDTEVLLLAGCRGGLLATLDMPAGEGGQQLVRDAVFWLDRIALLSGSEVRIFDAGGCPLAPAVLASGLTNAIALGVSAEGFLMVVQRDTPNLRLFRRDGSEVLAPLTFDGRGFYARRRNAALHFDPVDCVYLVDPALAAADTGDGGCCVDQARPMTDDESLLFRVIDDLADFRNRTAYPASGEVILGAERPEDPLDARRPGIQWHRLLLFGDIPEGCAVQVETRAADDILAGDPLITSDWSAPMLATTTSAVEVASPGDTRQASAAAMVLAGPGRYLWIRLTLLSNGVATPRIVGIDLELPRDGIARYLPRFLANSTPDDDFLRRWLALFENTVFDGVALRMDRYDQLFDPRTAPSQMLPFLAEWLQILELPRFRDDEQAFRFALSQANALAETRGTVDGLILAVRVYMGISIQIVESFKRGSGFVLGLGTTIDGVTGPALGCQTSLSAEQQPTWLGDAPPLGETFLLDCERRFGTVPFRFEVLVAAGDVCDRESLALLQKIIATEKPAHTEFRIRQTGAAGWVIGSAILGQSTRQPFDRNALEPSTFGILIQNGPPRPAPLGQGFALGTGSRLGGTPGAAPAQGQAGGMRVGGGALGRSTVV